MSGPRSIPTGESTAPGWSTVVLIAVVALMYFLSVGVVSYLLILWWL